MRVVWITMLAMSDAAGRVDGSVPGLADLSRVSVEECQTALKCLSDPDFFSRTKEHEGRRIKEIDGGWIILNYLKYREATPMDLRREQNREAQKRWREKHKLTVSKVSVRNPPSAHAEALGIEQKKPNPSEVAKAPRPRNLLLDALASIGGCDPLQTTNWSNLQKLLKEIQAVCPGVTVEEIRRRECNYAKHFTGSFTANAVVKHWALCDFAPNRSGVAGRVVPSNAERDAEQMRLQSIIDRQKVAQ